MSWSPDVIAGVTIALVLALIGWGGTVYCWIHKKKVSQGEISTVDRWLAKKGTAGAGFAGAQAGYADVGGAGRHGEAMEMQRPGRAGRERDIERDGDGGSVASTVVVEGVDTTGEPRAPPPVYDGRRQAEAEARRSVDAPGYQERV